MIIDGNFRNISAKIKDILEDVYANTNRLIRLVKATALFIFSPFFPSPSHMLPPLSLPSGFLPDNEFFKTKEVRASAEFYVSDWAKPSTRTMSTNTNLPVKDNQLILKKFLSDVCFDYEHDYDEERGRSYKIRGKNFDEIKKIRLKIEEVTCERVKEKINC